LKEREEREREGESAKAGRGGEKKEKVACFRIR
jgi:hypothetical protein